MEASVIIALITQVGWPLASKLIDKWMAGTPVTPTEWAELRVMGQQIAKDRMKAMLVIAGIPLDSPQAIALLALV